MSDTAGAAAAAAAAAKREHVKARKGAMHRSGHRGEHRSHALYFFKKQLTINSKEGVFIPKKLGLRVGLAGLL